MSAPGKIALPPGSVIGVLGNGQLGRMMALAAAPLDYRVHIYDPSPGPATQVTPLYTAGAWDDTDALSAFADAVDVVTWEFENVPAATARHLATRALVRPGVDVLATCQHRVSEKTFFGQAGVPTNAWRAASSAAEAAEACAELGAVVLKTARSGYDGRGQARASDPAGAAAAYERLAQGQPLECIVEALVPFVAECSVIVARDAHGTVATYDLCWNVHRDHILHTTTVPAPFGPATHNAAKDIATRIAERFDLVGLLAVELFLLEDGSLLVNELAPRPHNSGHWTIDATVCSQFEQTIRAVAGLPLGPTTRTWDVEMTNLLGDDVLTAADLLADPAARVHLYGKAAPRPKRKMGHVTRLLRRA